jgi:hypothetical protein
LNTDSGTKIYKSVQIETRMVVQVEPEYASTIYVKRISISDPSGGQR